MRVLHVLFFLMLSFAVSAQTDTAQVKLNCNAKGHRECVRITAREVFEHGCEGKWSHHWGRMSYIGEACVQERGERKGKTYEAVFAAPHYFAMFWVNVAGLTKYAFQAKKKRPAVSKTEPNSCVTLIGAADP